MLTPPSPQLSRNVVDRYKGLSESEIKADLIAKSFPASICFYNTSSDFNFASIVRNTNAFGFRKVFYISETRRWDKRGAVGTYHYTDIVWCPTVEDFLDVSKEFTPIALENNTDYECHNIYDFSWPTNPVIIIGSEGEGLSDALITSCSHLITIPQYGSIPSVNAAVAAGIAMNFYLLDLHRKG